MLISARNQIDWNGGYVNNWTTGQYVNYVNENKGKYKNFKLFLYRDHCGLGFKNNSIEDACIAIIDDIEDIVVWNSSI